MGLFAANYHELLFQPKDLLLLREERERKKERETDRHTEISLKTGCKSAFFLIIDTTRTQEIR